jgi:hypothetical protein
MERMRTYKPLYQGPKMQHKFRRPTDYFPHNPQWVHDITDHGSPCCLDVDTQSLCVNIVCEHNIHHITPCRLRQTSEMLGINSTLTWLIVSEDFTVHCPCESLKLYIIILFVLYGCEMCSLTLKRWTNVWKQNTWKNIWTWSKWRLENIIKLHYFLKKYKVFAHS